MIQIAQAEIKGNNSFPNISGHAFFYEDRKNGLWIEVEVQGLPDEASPEFSDFFGLHIHENGDCAIPFDQVGEHYNPTVLPHPLHHGDLPPLLSNHGYAHSFFYTERLQNKDVINRSIIIHSKPDDFISQPSGNAGDKIACGVIQAYR